MPRPPDHPHHLRRVVLPSGKSIEVVYFDDVPAAGEGRSARVPEPPRRPGARPELHHCGTCGSDLVYPVAWEEADATTWEVALRCPECEALTAGVYDQETVERFDDELDRGTEALVADLDRLVLANVEDEVRRFAAALDADHVRPEDF